MSGYRLEETTRMQEVFYKCLIYCMENRNKNCMFFVSKHSKISQLYGFIPAFIIPHMSINLNTSTIKFDSGCNILIRTPRTTVEQVKGLRVDRVREAGYASYEVWQELRSGRNKYERNN